MGIMDLLITELNENRTVQENGGIKRLHSEQYQFVQTENGLFKNIVKRN